MGVFEWWARAARGAVAGWSPVAGGLPGRSGLRVSDSFADDTTDLQEDEQRPFAVGARVVILVGDAFISHSAEERQAPGVELGKSVGRGR